MIETELKRIADGIESLVKIQESLQRMVAGKLLTGAGIAHGLDEGQETGEGSLIDETNPVDLSVISPKAFKKKGNKKKGGKKAAAKKTASGRT